MIVLHATIAILAVVLLIIVLDIDPVISLVVGSLYLGLAGGVGFEGTIEAIGDGFGEIMAEVGLLIGFGVLMGSLLFAMGALHRLVNLLLKVLGAKRLPYALAAVMTTLFPSIYVDVQLVLAVPAGPLRRARARPAGPRADGWRAHRRHPGRLRLRHPRPGHGLDRRPARRAARHDAGLRPAHRPAHRRHHRLPVRPAAQARLLEPGEGRARVRGPARGGAGSPRSRPRTARPRAARPSCRRCSCPCCRSSCRCCSSRSARSPRPPASPTRSSRSSATRSWRCSSAWSAPSRCHSAPSARTTPTRRSARASTPPARSCSSPAWAARSAR